ncbi:MAG: cation-translocating P-type ATPase [Hydrogenoanaerobacterium sp.]
MARREITEAQLYEGLSEREAEKRLIEYGENVLTGAKKSSPLKLFLGQFKDIMVMILLVATALSVFMGEGVEAFTISLIVLINAILGFLQEYRTEKTLEALKKLAAPVATVMRSGRQTELPACELVPGDLLLIKAGDRVPADAEIIFAAAIEADEALLSGESLPVEKTVEHKSMLYMGTNIVKGHCKAKVICTGMKTEMGKIAGMLSEIKEEKTPLQLKLDGMSKWLAAGCLLVCAVVTIAGIMRGEPVFDMLLTGISLSVAAIPEGLPAVVTIALAIAVKRMLGRGALIRKLHVVEAMGCANVICSDKTGTLTENRMVVKELYTQQYNVTVTNEKNDCEGEIICGGKSINSTLLPDVRLLLDIAVLCNNSFFEKENGLMRAVGEPTENALLCLAAKAKITREYSEKSFTRVGELPFDSVRKCMSVIVEERGGGRYLLTKGAPDVILKNCSCFLQGRDELTLTPTAARTFVQANEKMAKRALRVLAFAYRKLTEGETPQDESGLVLVGLAGMLDPPRKEAREAVRRCRRAGIKTVMITGDHKLTASAVAEELHILREGDTVLTGKELDEMDDAQLLRTAAKTTVYARVSPAHKLRIVRALKKQGNIVAMTGDGVNDAPAIKEADIGVAMGSGGTDVTKEASSLILLDNNFATLVAAIEEGRVIYRNIRKFIRYLLSCNIGEVITMFAGMLMGMPVVLLPIQILLINLATDGLPAIALGLEPADSKIMEERPRGKNETIFSGGLLSAIIFRGLLIGLTTLAVFTSFMRNFGSVELARTAAFATLVITQLIHVFECKSEEHGIFGIDFFNNKKLIAAVAISAVVLWGAIYVPFLAVIFKTVPLAPVHLMMMSVYIMAVPIASSAILFFKNRPHFTKNEATEKVKSKPEY